MSLCSAFIIEKLPDVINSGSKLIVVLAGFKPRPKILGHNKIKIKIK
jgi:hypothetical protein